MTYTNYQISALKQLKETVEYLNDVGLSVKSYMRQGCGMLCITDTADEGYYDCELTSEHIQYLLDRESEN